MSILNQLSDVLKEVFWIKTPPKKKSTARRKKVAKRQVVKKIVKKSSAVKTIKTKKIEKPIKPLKVAAAPKIKKLELDPALIRVGEITHYFERINVCVVKITHGTVLIGDKLTIVGQKSKFVQKVWSMQIESQDVKVAKKGQIIGLKVDKPVTIEDVVYK
ncbi:MAG: hypothetical protein HQL15_01215 [Candidatus Omnitrophica bacterium]|nr:hypothetical protein [Candidatus Omnitrophota bacterium]